MTDPEPGPRLPPETIWPPTPIVQPSFIEAKSAPRWFRPALWLGLAFNLLALMPAMGLLQVPYGKEDVSLDLHNYPQTGVIFDAVLALVIGVPLTLWQIRKRQKQSQPILWEIVGLLLCLLPLFVGLRVTSAVVMAKGFYTPDL